MAINNYFENTDINIYFHMKNHYRRLKSARSTIDNSFPSRVIQSVSSPPGSARSLKNIAFKERHTKSYQQETIKKSWSGTSKTSLNTINIQSRNKTKRNPSAVSSEMQYISRSEGFGLSSRSLCPEFNKTKKKGKLIRKADYKSSDILENMVDQHLRNQEINKSDTDERVSPKKTDEKINKQSKVHEHEYLQFLLRITEDIVMNNLYTNEDIENVFRTHIEANKNHLDLNKMEGQLARLCTELGIPYKYKNNSIDMESFDNLFAPSSCDNGIKLDNCECTTKRTLNIGVRRNEEVKKNEEVPNEGNNENDTKSYLNKMFNVLATRYSESQISSSLASCNSLSALVGSTQPILEQNLPSSDNDIFKHIEKLQITDQCSKDKFLHNDNAFSTEEKNYKDHNLTAKEKLGCMEEDVLFNKYNNSIKIGSTQNDYINECENTEYVASETAKELKNEYVNEPENIPNTSMSNNKFEYNTCMTQNNREQTKLCCEDEQTLGIVYKFEDDLKTNMDNVKENLLESQNDHRIENTENVDWNNMSLVECDNTSCNENITIPIKKHFPCSANESKTLPKNEIKTTSDQSVQIEVMQSDKECNTNFILDEYSENDYVLLNGPIYILRTILNSEDKLIIYDKDKSDKNVTECEMLPEKLYKDKIKSIQHCDSIPRYQTQRELTSSSEDDFLKLLNSDYDLMPQRDSDSSNNYHHLLVDATTSISNIDINKSVSSTLTNPDNLLLTNKYELNCQTTESPIFEMDNPSIYTFVETECGIEKRLSVASLDKLKNFSVLKKASQNGMQYSIKRKSLQFDGKVPSLDLPVSNHELFSMSILKGGDHVSKDVSESGEIIGVGMCTDDEQSTSRLDIDKNCSTSSSNRTHILGKRKLEHPT